jgi:hypothetical protein
VNPIRTTTSLLPELSRDIATLPCLSLNSKRFVDMAHASTCNARLGLTRSCSSLRAMPSRPIARSEVRPDRVICKAATAVDIGVDNFKKTIAVALGTGLLLCSHPASADLNRLEAAAGGEFNNGTALQYGEADIKGKDFHGEVCHVISIVVQATLKPWEGTLRATMQGRNHPLHGSGAKA